MAKRTKRRNNRSSKRYSKKSKRSSKRSSKRYSKRSSKKRYSKKRLYKRKMMRGGMEAVDIYLREARAAAIRLNPDNTAKVNRMNKEELLEWALRKQEGATGAAAAGGTVSDFQKIIDILSPPAAAPAAAAAAGGFGGFGAPAAYDEEEIAQAIAASLATAPAPAPAEYDEEAATEAAIAASLLTHPAPEGGRPPINVFFFDLDNTLTAKELEKRDNLIELAHPTDYSWTYTSQEVIDILIRINAEPNSMWYVISAGGNTDVLDMLERRLGFNANGRVFDLGEVAPKSEPIQQILNELKTTGHTFKSIAFIDDTQEKITEVNAAGIPGMKTIKVDSHFSPAPDQEMMEFWRNIILDNEKRQIDDILDS